MLAGGVEVAPLEGELTERPQGMEREEVLGEAELLGRGVRRFGIRSGLGKASFEHGGLAQYSRAEDLGERAGGARGHEHVRELVGANVFTHVGAAVHRQGVECDDPIVDLRRRRLDLARLLAMSQRLVELADERAIERVDELVPHCQVGLA